MRLNEHAAFSPDVSVLMIAYNVEDYIGEALDSVLMQNVSFTYEIVVGEDCSTDRTREILLEYAREHPDRIRLILRDRNLGMNPNFAATYLECTGKYVALLDGDDYWTSPYKLQRQVDFMEAHPECTVCFHNALVVYDDGRRSSHPFHLAEPSHHISAPLPKPISTLEDIARRNFIQTSSVLYRGGVVRALPDWYLTMPTFDWPLHVLHAERGDIGYRDEVLCAYRVHHGGFWSDRMSRYERLDDLELMIRAYHTLNRHLGYRYSAQIRRALSYHYNRAAQVALRDEQLAKARQYAARAMRSAGLGLGPDQRRAVQTILGTLRPRRRQRAAG
jgi:glycosyltransferase involved in cell wall biosynthesis